MKERERERERERSEKLMNTLNPHRERRHQTVYCENVNVIFLVNKQREGSSVYTHMAQAHNIQQKANIEQREL